MLSWSYSALILLAFSVPVARICGKLPFRYCQLAGAGLLLQATAILLILVPLRLLAPHTPFRSSAVCATTAGAVLLAVFFTGAVSVLGLLPLAAFPGAKLLFLAWSFTVWGFIGRNNAVTAGSAMHLFCDGNPWPGAVAGILLAGIEFSLTAAFCAALPSSELKQAFMEAF